MNTEWKDIKGYEGIAQVSIDGEVKVFERTVLQKNGRKRTFPERILSGTKDSSGYVRVGLTDLNGNTKTYRVHRLVAEAFLPNPEGKEHVNHKNSWKDDNRLENLEWVTASENNIHAYTLGHRESRKGTEVPQSKLTDDIALQVYLMANDGVTYKDISKWLHEKHGLSLSKSNVSNIKHKRTWKHIHNEKSPVWAD